MFAIFVVVLILASANGRITDPVERSLHISENVIDIDNIELKSIKTDSTKDSTNVKQSNADQKVDRNYALDEHVVSVNEINNEHINVSVVTRADTNSSETKIRENTNITEDSVTSTVVYGEDGRNKNTIETTKSIDNATVITPLAKNETSNSRNNSESISTTESNETTQETTKTETNPSQLFVELNNNTLQTIESILLMHPDLNNTNIIIRITNDETDSTDSPLKLTPYIREGLLDQARNASEVNSTMFLDYKSYSGYLTVDEQHDSNTFFWYFPVEGKPVEEAPWIIWFQGGPGISSMFGLFHEIGPFTIDKEHVLHKNPYSWLHNHSLVFIDNPVGVGFSFTSHEDGYATNMETYSAHLYEATRQLLLLYPELQRAPLYVAGESYAGKYVPSLALELHNHREDITVNLQGIILGNALVEPQITIKARPLVDMGVLNADEARALQPRIDKYNSLLAAGDHRQAAEVFLDIGNFSLFHSYLKNQYNYLRDDEMKNSLYHVKFLQRRSVRKALHASKIFRNINNGVYNTLRFEPSNVQLKIEALLEHYKVLAYCGNLDWMFPCVTAAENHRKWSWTGSRDFVSAHRNHFRFNNHVAGYIKTGGKFTEAVVIGAGHMVPADKPALAQDFITKWTHDKYFNILPEWTYILKLLSSGSIRDRAIALSYMTRNETMRVQVAGTESLNRTDRPTNETQRQSAETTTIKDATTDAQISIDTDHNEVQKPVADSSNDTSKNQTLNSQNRPTNGTPNQTSETPATEASTTEAEISNDIADHSKELSVEKSSKDDPRNVINEIHVPENKSQTDQATNKAKSHTTETPTAIVSATEAETSDASDESEEQKQALEGPLILTPYLKEGLLEQARNASEVNSTLFLGYKSYSGFFTVNETYNSNTFFWYFPVEGKPVEDAPWIIWLQGGPGITSMFGLTSEIGPFTAVDQGGLIKNPSSWLQNHSIVFIDNPVGVGFSFTEHQDGFAKDMETYSTHLYSATRQLLTLFPELQRAPLYVAGESYAGKYVPSLALELHRHKDEIQVNLQGLLVGNGYIDPAMLANFSRSFYDFGLLSPEDMQELRGQEELFDAAVLAKNSSLAKDFWTGILMDILQRTSLQQSYNYLHSESWGEALLTCFEVMQSREVKQAIHVGHLSNALYNITTNVLLKPEFLTSAKEKYEELMEHYRVLLYCGQLDQMMACGAASEFHRTFNWSGREAFVAAHKESFNFNDTLAAYHKTGGNLTEALIRGAGHMAPVDKGAPLREFVTLWTHGQPFPGGRIQEAREASKVDPQYFLNVTSHSGFLTVNETHNSNMFFWYFPAAGKNASLTPWIIWLQGGPGATSLAGVFDEMGPFSYNRGKVMLESRESTWCKDFSMLFIDNPVGAGYSFTDSEDGYASSMAMYSSHLYKALQQFLQIFPELRAPPLYIAGESYAGHYVPAFAREILDETPQRTDKDAVNLQGIMLGNPVLERGNFAEQYTALYQQWGLVDSQGALAVRPLQEAHSRAVRDEDPVAAAQTRAYLLDKLDEISQQPQEYNLLHDEYQLKDFVEYIRLEQVREAMHTGLVQFTFSNHSAVQKMVAGDFLAHMRPVLETLLERYRVLIYCGQLDLIAPCTPNAEARRKKWNWSQRDLFLRSPRDPWWFNESIAGYVKSGGGLTEVLVRGAGHLVPVDKPAQAQQLISFFIRGLDYPLPPNYHPVDPVEYKEYSPSVEDSSSGYRSEFIVSLVANILFLGAVVAGVIFYRLRLRREDAWMYADNVPSSDSVLSLA